MIFRTRQIQWARQTAKCLLLITSFSFNSACTEQPWRNGTQANDRVATGFPDQAISKREDRPGTSRLDLALSADTPAPLTDSTAALMATRMAARDSASTQETIAILWGKFSTQIAQPDPEHHIEAESAPRSGLFDAQQIPADPHTVVPQPLEAGNTDGISPIPSIANNSLWDRIRAGFSLPDRLNRKSRNEAVWYSQHPDYIDRTLTRAQPYLHYIVEALDKQHMPMEIALLPIVESAFQPFAYSHGRASGIWQFIPGTARHFGLKINWWYDGRRDIIASTQAALAYLGQLNKEFNGDWELALAAYNSGAGTVRKAIRRNQRQGRPTDFWSLKLPRETQAYVPKLLALKAIVAHPEQFNIHLKSIADASYLSTVEIGSQIDLALAAEMASIPLDELYRLNPGYNHWATAPDGPHRLMIPQNKVAGFKERLAQIADEDRIHWIRHRIKRGETLGHIARHYQTSIAVIKQVNKIHGHMIRSGKSLMIPVATRDLADYALSAKQRLRKIKSHRPSPQRRKVTHLVRRGDTLWDLARKYRVRTAQLARWNGMSPRDILHRGQHLVIWKRHLSTTQTPLRASTSRKFLHRSPDSKQTTRRIHYVVRKGDSLARISQRFRVKIAQLRRWNHLPKGRYLQPGQHLTLYIDVTRQFENI